MVFILIPPILIFPEHQQEENKEKEYQKLMTEEQLGCGSPWLYIVRE
jgi:hypothetical protein